MKTAKGCEQIPVAAHVGMLRGTCAQKCVPNDLSRKNNQHTCGLKGSSWACCARDTCTGALIAEAAITMMVCQAKVIILLLWKQHVSV